MWRYIQNVKVLPEYEEILRIKQGGSRERALKNWRQAREEAVRLIGNFSQRDFLILIASIYWGEGTKKSFSLINGDPYLIRSYIQGLIAMGVKKDDIKLNFRLFSDMDRQGTINFWLEFLGFENKHVGTPEIIGGNGKKKLIHGMCRVTVIKGGAYFKQVISMIDLIKSQRSPRSSMDRTGTS